MYSTSHHDHRARLYHLAETLSATIDSEFDGATDDLEREFQELRVQLADSW